MTTRTGDRAGTGAGPHVGPGRLVRAAGRLLDRVGHWTGSRWATTAPVVRAGIPSGESSVPGAPSRAQVMHGLVQRLADLGADAEGRPRRTVPRLDNDLVLPDQVKVTLRDLLAADPPAQLIDEALVAVDRAAREL